ncbi:MAG: DUF3592 domain-containing protein [Armatimonadetes bacterium]|nr:DUF3592 domain-containing protein [Armatimonadota bacterium]
MAASDLPGVVVGVLWSCLGAMGVAGALAVARRDSAARRGSAASQSWPSTSGTVTDARLDRSHWRSAEAQVTYEYVVAGKTYTSRRYAFMTAGESIGKLSNLRLVESFPPGTVVTVYYDSADPSQATLVRGGATGRWSVAVAYGLLVPLCGLATLSGLVVLMEAVRKVAGR